MQNFSSVRVPRKFSFLCEKRIPLLLSLPDAESHGDLSVYKQLFTVTRHTSLDASVYDCILRIYFARIFPLFASL